MMEEIKGNNNQVASDSKDCPSNESSNEAFVESIVDDYDNK